MPLAPELNSRRFASRAFRKSPYSIQQCAADRNVRLLVASRGSFTYWYEHVIRHEGKDMDIGKPRTFTPPFASPCRPFGMHALAHTIAFGREEGVGCCGPVVLTFHQAISSSISNLTMDPG